MAAAGEHGSPPLWLLILPQPPSIISLSTLRAAFGPGLSEVLRKLSQESSATETGHLDIAISFPDVPALGDLPRTILYSHFQHFLAVLYRLICIIYTEKSIDQQHDNDVNARVVLLGGETQNSPGVEADSAGLLQGPVIDLKTLARSHRVWAHVCSIESEDGEASLQGFLSLRKSMPTAVRLRNFTTERLAGGLGVRTSDLQQQHPRSINHSTQRHYSVAVGGTFDHLHAGHKLLLTATAFVLESFRASSPTRERSLTIGITGDELLRNKNYAHVMQSWHERQDAVYQFLLAILSFEKSDQATQRSEGFSREGPNGKSIHYELKSGLVIKCVEISDPFGPTITDRSISALVVSGETRSGGKAVNEKRAEKGWPALEVFEVDVLDNHADDDESDSDRSRADFQDKISSTAIRRRIHERRTT
ncbi:hypothetical protein MMC24_005327 [Lignoscripta atroalba]|nr:hypothetical protein [Lignoscripta atroalba]